jgi:hypothetical protein
MLKGIVLAAGAFGLFLPLHVVLLRTVRPHARFKAMMALHAALAVALLVVYAATPPDLVPSPRGWGAGGSVIGALNAVAVHWFLFMGYSMFYFLVDRGFSLRIMIEVERAGALSREGIAAAYPPEGVVRRRLDEMVEIGRLVREGDRYRLTPRGRFDARMFAWLKAFLQFGPGG